MRNQSLLKIGLAALALSAMASCSHDYAGPDIPGSQLKVTASIQELSSRANGTQWETGDAIGIHDETMANNINVKYTGAADGAFSPAKDPIYVLGAATVKFNAYYPYNEDVTADVPAISFDAGSGDDVDFMWATASASRENAMVNFVFTHMMSKVKITINGDEAQSGSEMTVTLKNVTTKGTFHTLTGEIMPSEEKSSVTCASTVGKSAEFIVPPLDADAAAPEVTLEITVNDITYQGTFNPLLPQSSQSNYTVNLGDTDEQNNVTISSATITGWTPADGGEIKVDEVDAENVLEVGDFYLADGTIIDRRASLTDEQKAKVAGIVYYVGNPEPSSLYADTYDAANDLLLKDHPKAVNGLAVAVEYPAKGAHFMDIELAGDAGLMNAWLMTSGSAGIYSARYQWIDDAVSTSKADTKGENNLLGYNNTSLWKQFAAAKSLPTTGTDDFIALALLDEYAAANPLPDDASGWYIPSLGEMKLMITMVDAENKTYEPLKELASSMAKLGNDVFLLRSRYWTSTEGRINSDKAQTMAVTFWKSEAWTLSFSPTNNATTAWYHFCFAF